MTLLSSVIVPSEWSSSSEAVSLYSLAWTSRRSIPHFRQLRQATPDPLPNYSYSVLLIWTPRFWPSWLWSGSMGNVPFFCFEGRRISMQSICHSLKWCLWICWRLRLRQTLAVFLEVSHLTCLALPRGCWFYHFVDTSSPAGWAVSSWGGRASSRRSSPLATCCWSLASLCSLTASSSLPSAVLWRILFRPLPAWESFSNLIAILLAEQRWGRFWRRSFGLPPFQPLRSPIGSTSASRCRTCFRTSPWTRRHQMDAGHDCGAWLPATTRSASTNSSMMAFIWIF